MKTEKVAPARSANAVVLKFGALGDVVRTAHVVAALVREFGTDVTWVTTQAASELLRFNPSVQHIIVYGRDEIPRRATQVISLDDETVSAAIAGAIEADRVTGAYVERERVLYTDDSKSWFDMGLISRLGKNAADIKKRENQKSHAQIFREMLGLSEIHPVFFGNSVLEEWWRQRRAQYDVVIGINAFAGPRWPAKEMPPSEYMELFKKIDDFFERVGRSHRIVLFSDESNIERARAYVEGSKSLLIWDTSESVLEFAAAVRACDYLISTDSLGLHLAIAQNVPNLSFFAPTSAAEIETFGTGVKVLSTAPDYCSYKPLADNRTLTADRVFGAWREHSRNLSRW
jgi:heptosyltransferase-2